MSTITPSPETTILPVITEHIVMTPGTCGGKPRIAGHRIKVEHVVIWHERMGMSPAEIVERYPTITLADVHAALAYYYDHREDILADIKAGAEFVAELKAKTPSRVTQKLHEKSLHATDDPLPSG